MLLPPARRYAVVHTAGEHRLPRARRYIDRLRDVPQAVRSVPYVSGGARQRWERGAWVIRPCTGWRSFWFTRPLHRTREIPREDTEAAADWVHRVYLGG
ncbi:hypothetical protein HCN51_55055 [Nonomuraea sp. FMUSA5-5]|uniref:Uncharacterized protein n=1 Tax=Nonomuraea composti TaxID=2720023 RepID=A0ABX1BPV5_9ACTN|nr:hypothetical protein [Nonomuraea sp. FMUSA5-5]NJP98450.1 hypothetical protein [Nonomuraea sp. FMUSA5-5]